MPRQERVAARIRELTKEIDLELGIQSSERFWSAPIATALACGEVAHEMGLLGGYDLAYIRKWAIEVQVPRMRGIVKEEYSDPLGILTDYLETISNNMLVMEKLNHNGGNLHNLLRQPHGALLAHFDTDERMLYVLKKGFKDYCVRIGANSLKVLSDLNAVRDGARIVPLVHIRRTLGAGTEYAKAQSWCFVINTAHPEISGAVDLKVLTGGGAGTDKQVTPIRAVP